MSQFEFTTKEQREAWRVIRDLIVCDETLQGLRPIQRAECLDQAASRFDLREKTCGIEPLSEEHFALGVCSMSNYYWVWGSPNRIGNCLLENKLIKPITIQGIFQGHNLTDKGRTVLENLNAMCKVEKNG